MWSNESILFGKTKNTIEIQLVTEPYCEVYVNNVTG